MYFPLYLLDGGLAWERVFSLGAPLLGMQILGPPLGGRGAPSFQFSSTFFSPERAVTCLLGKSRVCSSGTFAGPLMKLTSKPACRARKEEAAPSLGVGAGLASYLAAQPLAFSVAWGKSFNLWFFPLHASSPPLSSPPGDNEKSLAAVCQVSPSFA